MLIYDDSESKRRRRYVNRNQTCYSITCVCILGPVCTILVIVYLYFLSPNNFVLDFFSSHNPLESLSTNANIKQFIPSSLVTSSSSTPASPLIGSDLQQYFLNHNQRVIHELRPPIITTPPSERDLPYQPLLKLIEEWNPDQPEIPPTFQEKLQNFDYGNPEERELAIQYRNAEIPFKLFNISDFQQVSALWTDDYLSHNLETVSHRYHVEKSKSNHFMFWSGHSGHLRNYIPPTDIVSGMTFQKWLNKALEADRLKISNDSVHFYFMAGAEAKENGRTFMSRDLQLFSTNQNNFFISNVQKNKGIQCRFGMRGLIAEAHYDSGRNMVAMLKGQKRYILTPPWACERLGIIADTRHPSYRHSVIDWSDLQQAKQSKFDEVDAIHTILHNGEVLYIPSFWFHYIVSLEYSIQCNSRSGFPKEMKGQEYINQCLNHGAGTGNKRKQRD